MASSVAPALVKTVDAIDHSFNSQLDNNCPSADDRNFYEEYIAVAGTDLEMPAAGYDRKDRM